MRLLVLTLLLISCGRVDDQPSRMPATDDVRAQYESVSQRLMSEFLEDGQVVSRKPDGSPEHLGDSLIWTGVAIGVLPCQHAKVLADRLAQRLVENEGELVRFEPLPEEYQGGREISFDGETGILYGIAAFSARCEASFSREALRVRRAYLDGNGGKLHRNSGATIPAEFTFTTQAVYHAYGLEGEPHGDRLITLSAQIAGWLQAVKTSKSACFRANLAWLHLRAIDALGYDLPDLGRRGVCDAAMGLDGLAHFDHYCGRSTLQNFIDDFQVDQYEFALQRCSWESPDGKSNRSPALDLLLALTELYDLH